MAFLLSHVVGSVGIDSIVSLVYIRHTLWHRGPAGTLDVFGVVIQDALHLGLRQVRLAVAMRILRTQCHEVTV